MNAKLTPSKPLLFLLYGSPGSGKTYFSRQLAEVLQCAHVQTDRIRAELFERPTYNDEENGIVNHLAEYMAEEFLGSGVSVILDSNADRLTSRQRLRNMARSRKAQPVLVWLQTDFESAYARLNRRDRRKADDKYSAEYSPEQFRHAISRMQNPKNEDFSVLSGKHTFGSQKNMIMRKLMEMGLLTKPVESGITKPGLVNLIPHGGRVDHSRRNIVIR
ncbi:MAG: ATP-binding protein [bacterium]|nr:ATP-binding protein [bacterium]